MQLSINNYVLQSSINIDELKNIIKKNIFFSESLINKSTSNLFIGQIEDNKFKIIESSSPLGFVCIIEGELIEINNQSEISIETKINQKLILLFKVSIIVLFSLIFVFAIVNSSYIFFIGMSCFLFFMSIIFRLILHVAYLVSRNKVLNKIKLII